MKGWAQILNLILLMVVGLWKPRVITFHKCLPAAMHVTFTWCRLIRDSSVHKQGRVDETKAWRVWGVYFYSTVRPAAEHLCWIFRAWVLYVPSKPLLRQHCSREIWSTVFPSPPPPPLKAKIWLARTSLYIASKAFGCCLRFSVPALHTWATTLWSSWGAPSPTHNDAL